MAIFKVGEVVIFEIIYKRIYLRIFNLKNSIDCLLIREFDLNYNTN